MRAGSGTHIAGARVLQVVLVLEERQALVDRNSGNPGVPDLVDEEPAQIFVEEKARVVGAVLGICFPGRNVPLFRRCLHGFQVVRIGGHTAAMHHKSLGGPQRLDYPHRLCALRILRHDFVARRRADGQHGDIRVAVQEDLLDIGLTIEAVDLPELRIRAPVGAAGLRREQLESMAPRIQG